MPRNGVIITVLRRWMILLPCLLLFGATLHSLSRSLLATYVARTLEDLATTHGVELSFDTLDVGFTGIEIEGVAIKEPTLGSIRVGRISASLDLGAIWSGDVHFRRIELDAAQVIVARAAFEDHCVAWNLCGKIPRSPTVGSTLATTVSGGEARPSWNRLVAPVSDGTSAPADLGLLSLSDEWRVGGLSMEVESARWVSVHSTTLQTFRRGDRLHIFGDGQLTSPYAVEPTVFKVAAWIAGDEAFEIAAALEDNLEISTPIAHLSLGGMGARSGPQTTVWLDDVLLTPFLLGVASPWGADRVQISVPHLSTSIPVLELAGVKGHIDLRSLSELALWLAAAPDSELEPTPDLVLLRNTLLRGLSDVRSALYGADLTIEVTAGDIQLHYDDGSVFALRSARMMVGGVQEEGASLRLDYEAASPLGRARIPDARGQLAVRLNRFTPAQIAEWSSQ